MLLTGEVLPASQVAISLTTNVVTTNGRKSAEVIVAFRENVKDRTI